jgi:hypothetical protein
MGDAAFEEIKAEFEKRVEAGNFIEVEGKTNSRGRAFTTQEMIDCERDTIRTMRQGQNKHAPLASFPTRREIEKNHHHLSQSQRAAVEQILASRDQVTALEGVAGAGKKWVKTMKSALTAKPLKKLAAALLDELCDFGGNAVLYRCGFQGLPDG